MDNDAVTLQVSDSEMCNVVGNENWDEDFGIDQYNFSIKTFLLKEVVYVLKQRGVLSEQTSNISL